MIRILLALLLLMPIVDVTRLGFAEYHYARGMAAGSVQESIDHLTLAGEFYPAAFTFRTAQARQLFELSRRLDGLAPAAGESLARAIAIDQASADLVSKLLAVEHALGRCDQAQITAARLMRLAPRSETARLLASQPCPG